MTRAAAAGNLNDWSGAMKIGAICNEKVVTVGVAATLAEAGRSLAEHHVEALVVIASAVPRPTAIGIITDRDILRAAIEHPGDFTDLRVLDILSPTPLVLNQDEDVDAAIRKMAAARVRFAPVIGTGGTLRGAISQSELLGYSASGWTGAPSADPQPRR
jgi:CBS domain-containing protein